MDLDTILGDTRVPRTHVFVADSDQELEAIQYDEACSYTGLYAITPYKQFLVERIHYKNLTQEEKRAENIELYRLLIGELGKYGISRKEADLTFSDEKAVPNFIKYLHEDNPVQQEKKPSYLMLLPLLVIKD